MLLASVLGVVVDPIVLLLLVRFLDAWLWDFEVDLQRTQDEVESLWRDTDPWDGDSVEEFTVDAADLTVGLQRRVVESTSWVRRSSAELLGLDSDFTPDVADDVRVWNPDFQSKFSEPSVIIVGGEESLRVPNREVFNRPARELRRLISESESFDPTSIRERSVRRVRDIVSMNATLAQRDTEQQYIEDVMERNSRVVGFRRVIHPERSLGGVCGLCLAASQRVYKRKDLKEIHLRCKCTVSEVMKGVDPGFELNNNDLKTLYNLAGGTGRKQLKRIRYKSNDNGELGPVLVPAKGQKVEQYTSMQGITDLDEADRSRKLAEFHLPKYEQRLNELLTRGLTDASSQVQYHEKMIRKFRKTLAAV